MASSSSRDSGSRGSSAGSRDVVVGTDDNAIVITNKRNTTGDTCGYYHLEDSQSCRQPRSCYDCLNTALPSASEGCVLNPSGVCQPLTAYVSSLDYRANHNNSLVKVAYQNYFPSINSTYCEATDPACARCEMIASSIVDVESSQTLLGQWNGSREVVQRFCEGSEGCVCLAACVPAKWKNNVAEDCSNANYNSTGVPSYSTTDNYRSMLPIFMIMQLVLIVMVIHRQKLYANRFRARPPQVFEGPYNNARPPSPSNRLQLTGWRSMQAEMVQREKAQRGLVSLMSPRTGPDGNPPTSVQQDQDHDDADGESHQQRQTPQHNYVIYDPNDDDDDIPELPVGTPMTPVHGVSVTRRRGSTDASLAMLEDGRSSDVGPRPHAVSISEEREIRSL